MTELPYSFPIRWYGDAIDAYAPFADRRGAFSLAIDKRYTLIGWEPRSTFSATGAFITIDGHTRIDSPISALQNFSAQFQNLPQDPYFPFYSGLVGYVLPSFEAATQDKTPSRGDTPDAWFGVYDPVIVHDAIENRLTVLSLGLDADLSPSLGLAEERATALVQILTRYNGKPASHAVRDTTTVLASPFGNMTWDDIQTQYAPS
jgi:anthranilate/para-aminobenzoate synthase component I